MLNHPILDIDFAAVILMSLPPLYNSLIDSLNYTKGLKLDINHIITCILKCDQWLKSKNRESVFYSNIINNWNLRMESQCFTWRKARANIKWTNVPLVETSAGTVTDTDTMRKTAERRRQTKARKTRQEHRTRATRHMQQQSSPG